MTIAPPAGQPLVLQLAPDQVFGTFHGPPTGSCRGIALLMCAPWGWDEITSYRARRAWSQRLAETGWPTLRIDLPSVGDSGGDPTDPDRVGAWQGAVIGAASWLAALPDVSSVVAIGLGLGGLIAAAAIADGAAIDGLVLWAAPESGRAWIREQRAFAGLQGTRVGPADAPAWSGLPDGWLEVGGFVLSADTIDALGALDLATMQFKGLERVLLLDRDGIAPSARLVGRLAEQQIAVSQSSGAGWSQMVSHPEAYAEPTGVFERVSSWLDEAPDRDRNRAAAQPPLVANELEITRSGIRIRERPVRIGRTFGDLFGLLAEAPDATPTGVCGILLNAGAVRRVGPNRLWVDVARRWATRGVPTFRLDVEGVGDSDGDPRRYRDVGNFYTSESGRQVGAAIDHLSAHGLGPRFVLIGLCAGAYWALHNAAIDKRITAAIVLNPRAMIWDDDLLARRDARHAQRLVSRSTWTRVLRGEITLGRTLAVSRAMLGRAAATVVARAGGQDGSRRRAGLEAAALEGLLDGVRDQGVRLVLAFSGAEPVHGELAAVGILDRLDRWPNLVLESLPGEDHTLRPVVAQQAAVELLDRELDRLIRRTAG